MVKNFNKTLMKQLQRYSKVLDKDVQKVAKEVANEAKRDVQRGSPVSEMDRKGQYQKGWGVVFLDGAYIVRNKTDYRLTHLLERGHVLRDGTGRKVGQARAFEHIEPVEKDLIKEFEKRIDKLIDG